MRRFPFLCRAAIVWLGGITCALAQTGQPAVREMRVQLAAGFDPIQGRLITAGDTLVFLDDSQPSGSFFATRSQIERINTADGEAVSIQFNRAIRDRTGERMRVELRMSPEDRDALRTWSAQAGPVTSAADRQRADSSGTFPTYPARRNKLIGGDNGRLVVKPDRLAFEADSPGASREWLFSDIKEFKQRGPYRLEIEPFSGDEYELELLGGGGMAREDFQRIADNIARARTRR